MKHVVTAVAAPLELKEDAQVRLTLPPDARIRRGSPFCDNMKAVFVGPAPDDENRCVVKIDGARVSWLKEHVHAV
jgi:hypothetical protein